MSGQATNSVGTNVSINDWLDRLADRTPTPGGGSVAALAGALGCAVGEMALRFSVGRKGNEAEQDDKLKAALQRLGETRPMLLRLCVEDQLAYAGWRAAKGLADDDAAKSETLEQATAASIAVPLATMAAALKVLAAATDVAAISNPWLKGDLLCCGDLAVAAVRCGRYNVLANAPADSPDVAEADAMLARAVELVQRLGEAT